MQSKDWLTIIVAVLGLTFGLMQYMKTSRHEFLKPIREAQLNLYQEASSVAAKLSTLPPDGAEWKAAQYDFLRLYYGPLAIVENYHHQPSNDSTGPTVEQAMIAFKICLDDKSYIGSKDMHDLSLGLAHTCRVSLGATWGFHAAQLDGDYQELITAYLAKKSKSSH